MISRRKFTTTGAAAMYLGWSGPRSDVLHAAMVDAKDEAKSAGVLQHVKPKIGTGGHGHCYPGATVPFGMVQLSPDTFNRGWDWCSGYNYSDDSIMGFSHTHLSGTGIGDMLDFLVMACTGDVKTVPGTRENPEAGYRSRFSHDDEYATPGYYSVLLKDYGVRAELTAATRAGFHRYSFPENEKSYLILDLDHGYADGKGVVQWASLKVAGRDTISGGKSTLRWAKGREIYFNMKFSRPFDRIEILADGKAVGDPSKEIRATSLKAIVHYATKSQEKILVKTGISGVSSDGASRNLAADIPDWNFDRVRLGAAAEWERLLSRVQIEGGTQKQREIFYTSLYHCMLAPTIFDDVDGSYRAMDGQNRKLKKGDRNFSTYSLWDTYRALHPLFTVVCPERVTPLANCLIRMSEESPIGMPIWPLQAKETQTMTGYHSATVIAEAIQKEFPGIDIRTAYAVMKKQATENQLRGLPFYRRYGYIPCDLHYQSVSTTLDYNYNDWAVACVAKAAGALKDAETFRERSLLFGNVYDKTTGFMRPKLANGEWALPFANNEIGHWKKWRDYTESNPWQATFAVQHDPAGLAKLMGGREEFAEKLDEIFTTSSEQPSNAPPDIAGLVGQYAHGNEPSHHIAYLYTYVGQAYKTQERVSSLMETMYKNEPDGLTGNEDCGQMSAWYVLSAMGFYAVDPISGNYVFGSPLFDKVTVDTGNGRRLVVKAERSSPRDIYVKSATLNGKNYRQAWFSHKDLVRGATFTFQMSSQPIHEFGSDPELAPPSASSREV